MKLFLAALLISAPALSFAATQVSSNDDVVTITIYGGKGSQAEKLYNSLTKVEEVGDSAMGGRSGAAKQAKAIECSVENDRHKKNAYECSMKLSTGGDSLSPLE